MTEVKVFKYKTALSRKMASPGGLLVTTALAQAETALDGHREAAMVALDVLLTELEQASAAQAQGDIYPKAAELLDMAGFFETGPLHPALFSLCDIAECMNQGAGWDWPCVQVHVRSLRMILSHDCRDTEETQTLLEGLDQVKRSVCRRVSGEPARPVAGAGR